MSLKSLTKTEIENILDTKVNQDNIEKLKRKLEEKKIIDNNSAAIAIKGCRIGKEYAELIESVYKNYTKDYKEMINRFEEVFKKEIIEILNRVQRIKKDYINYKLKKIDELDIDPKIKLIKLEKSKKEIRKEKENIERITNHLYAKIFGGEYVSNKGKKTSSDGINSTERLRQIKHWIEAKLIPEKLSNYELFIKAYNDIKIEITELLEYNKEVIGKDEELKDKRNSFKKRLETIISKANKNTTKNINKVIKETEEEKKHYYDSLTEGIDFDIINENNVPDNLKEPSKKKIKEVIKNNKERIKLSNFKVDGIIFRKKISVRLA